MRFEKWQALGNDYLIVEAEGLPWELTRRGSGGSAIRTSVLVRTGAAAFTQRGPGLRRRAADLQPRRLGGRALGKRGARGDPLPAPARLDRRRHLLDWTAAGPVTPTITSERTCSVEMGRATTLSKDFPSGAPTAADRWRGRTDGLSSTSRSAIPSARSRSARGSRSLTWPRSGRRSKATSCFPTGPMSRSTRRRQPGAGADLRAWRGGDALLRHRRQRRGHHRLPAGRRARSRSSSTAVSWRSRSPTIST